MFLWAQSSYHDVDNWVYYVLNNILKLTASLLLDNESKTEIGLNLIRFVIPPFLK